MLNKIPFLGWFFSAVAAISLAVPFWLCWTWWGVGVKYFYWLPEIYQIIMFWDCVALFIVIAILKGTLIPRLFYSSKPATPYVTYSQTVTNKEKKED